MTRQVIVTTLFGPGVGSFGETFLTFSKIPNSELHAFVFGSSLPASLPQGIQFHLVEPDPRFVSVRRDALFRRWTLPDTLGAEYALVVDGTDVICVRPVPAFDALLRGASFAAATEWRGPVPILGQGYTSNYMNAGVTFWHLPSSREMRAEIVTRGRSHYRGPFDDQTVLNEVMLTKYFDQTILLPSQYNWRAFYKASYRSWTNAWRAWPRLDSLDGVYFYHNNYCLRQVFETMNASPPGNTARLEKLPEDQHPLSRWEKFQRRVRLRWGQG